VCWTWFFVCSLHPSVSANTRRIKLIRIENILDRKKKKERKNESEREIEKLIIHCIYIEICVSYVNAREWTSNIFLFFLHLNSFFLSPSICPSERMRKRERWRRSTFFICMHKHTLYRTQSQGNRSCNWKFFFFFSLEIDNHKTYEKHSPVIHLLSEIEQIWNIVGVEKEK